MYEFCAAWRFFFTLIILRNTADVNCQYPYYTHKAGAQNSCSFLYSVTYIQNGRNAMTEIQKQQIQSMRSNGLVFADIANKLHLSVNSVKSYCRRNAIQKQDVTSALCKHCGAVLINTPGHRQKIFCSAACQQKYWWENRNLMQHHALISVTCPACGKSFTAYKGHHRKYCSHTCYIADRYRKADAHESE